MARFAETKEELGGFVLIEARDMDEACEVASKGVSDREELTLVVFAEARTEPLLGAYALEGPLLSPDPIRRQLVPVPGLLKGAVNSRACSPTAMIR
jgi:hypothetical protein